MTLGLFSDGNGHRYRRDLAELARLGVDSVSLHVAWGTPTVRAVEMAPRPRMTPSDERLRGAVRAAHGHGMRVLLFPLLFVDHLEEEEWRGVLDPRDTEAWWANYRAFLLRYARLAAEEGVEILSLGSELCSQETQAERWRTLAREVRAVFPGRLTYSANWDHLDPMLEWASVLDLAGMNAYHEVGREGRRMDQLTAAWEPVRDRLAAWRDRHGLPVLITEIGYPSVEGGTVHPWDYTRSGNPAPEEQLLGYRAFRRAWEGTPWLRGVYFYIWWGPGGPEDRGYTPRGKPAAAVLADWYGGKALSRPRIRRP